MPARNVITGTGGSHDRHHHPHRPDRPPGARPPARERRTAPGHRPRSVTAPGRRPRGPRHRRGLPWRRGSCGQGICRRRCRSLADAGGPAGADGYRRPAAAARALVAAYGDHYMLAVSRRVSAHPERVDHQIEMPAPVEPWPRAHRADHAADQHRDVGRLYAGTDRPRAPGASDQLSDDRDQLVLLGLRFRPGRLRRHCSPARTGPRRPRRPSPRYGAAAPRSARTVLRRPRAPRAPTR